MVEPSFLRIDPRLDRENYETEQTATPTGR